MTDIDTKKITDAAGVVLGALQSLTDEESARVLHAAASLRGMVLRSDKSGPIGNHADKSDATESSLTPRGGKRQSVVEFLSERQPATNAQRIACFAHYREHVENRGTGFARADLEPYFASAKLPKPGNYDRDFGKAVSAGWIHEDGANSYLTQSGEEVVKAGFAGKGKARGAAVARRKSPAVERTP